MIPPAVESDTFAAVYKFAEAAFARSLSPLEAELVGELVDNYALSIEDWREVFKATARQNVRKLAYVEAVAKNFHKPKEWYELYKEES